LDAPAAPATRRSHLLLIAASAAVTTVVFLSAMVWLRPRAEVSWDSVHLTTMLPPGVSVTRGPGLGSSVAVSPDGRTLVVAGTRGDGQRLYRRPLNGVSAAPLAGTERASSPFFSWDGEWIGFFADGRLKRVPAAGGTPVDIVAVPVVQAGASWGPDNRIVFAYGAEGRLHSVDWRGGSAQPLKAVKSAYYPELLPDGRTLLFVGTSS
jgi:Tol biopolymer transport system component